MTIVADSVQAEYKKGTTCPHAHECTCITGGVVAEQRRSFPLQGDTRTLAGNGLPACHHEIREYLAPGKTGKQILEMFPRMRGVVRDLPFAVSV